jgi:hypothetical protein
MFLLRGRRGFADSGLIGLNGSPSYDRNKTSVTVLLS